MLYAQTESFVSAVHAQFPHDCHITSHGVLRLPIMLRDARRTLDTDVIMQDDVPPQHTSQENSDKQGTLAYSCLLPWAQHQFDWLMDSVLHQLSLQGWQLVMTHLLLPDGMPVTITTQEVPTFQLSSTHLKRTAYADSLDRCCPACNG